MAGTPSTTHRLVKDYGQPRKFLRDMRAKAHRNSSSGSRKSGPSRRP